MTTSGQPLQLDYTGFARYLMEYLANVAIINIKPSQIAFQDGTQFPQIAAEMQKLYRELASQGIVPNSRYMQENAFFAKLLDEGALFLEKLLNTPVTVLTRIRFHEFYKYFIQQYTKINPIKNSEQIIEQFKSDDHFRILLAKLLYLHIVISTFNKYRRNVIRWRRSIIHNDINNTIPLELRTYLLLSNVPVTYTPSFLFRPQTSGIMRLISDLSTFEIEIVLIMAIYVLVLLKHPKKSAQGTILSGSYQDAIDLLGYISPMLYMLGFTEFANYTRSKALEFLYEQSGHNKELQTFKELLKKAEKYASQIKRILATLTKQYPKIRKATIVYRIKKAGSTIEKLVAKNTTWITDLVGLTLVIEDSNWYKQNGLIGIIRYILYLIDNLPKNIKILGGIPARPDIQVNWGSKRDIVVFGKQVRKLKGVTRIKILKNKYKYTVSFTYKNIDFTVEPMRDSGYEAAHITLFAHPYYGAEIKVMTRRVYDYQKFGLGAHFLYKLKLDISKRAQLVRNYRDKHQITREAFFTKAQRTVQDLGFAEAKQRGERFMQYLKNNKQYGFSSPQNLYKTMGYIEQNYPWLYQILTELKIPQMVKDPYYKL